MAFSQDIARPVRTAVQLGLAAAIIECIDAFLGGFNDRQYAAALAMLTIIIGFIQVTIENRTGKALLRVPPGPEVEVIEVVEEAPLP